MSHSLKIDGDFSSVKKGVKELAKEFKSLGKTPTSIFSKEDAALLSRQTLDVTKALEKELDKINRNAERFKKVMKNNTLNAENQVKAAKKYNQMLKERVSIQKSLGQIKDFEGAVRGPSRAGRFGGGLSKGVGSIPGMGTMSKLGGLGMMGGLGLGVGALGAFGAYKGYQGYQQFKGGAGQRLKMAGRGIEDTSGISPGLAKLGYTPEQIRNQQLKGQTTFGKEGGTQGAVLQRAQFERARGLDKGSMTEASQGLRGSMGAKGAQEAMFKMQATILANNITDNIGPFLETSAAMLTSMNENGLPADSEVLALMASMTKGGTSEARSMRQIMSANQAVKGSTGDANAFIQSMFAGKGIGGGTVGGAQEAISMGGLFGTDESKLKDQFGMSEKQIKDYQKLGITGKGTGFKGRTGGMLDFAKENFGGSPQETLRKGKFFKEIFGTQSGGEALGFLNKLEKAQGDPKKVAKIEKEIKEAAKSPEMKVQEDIKIGIEKLNGIDANIEGFAGRSAMALEEIGTAFGDTGAMVSEALTSIDGGVAAIAKFLTGYESPSELRKQKEARKKETERIATEGFKSKGFTKESFGQLTREQQRDEQRKVGAGIKGNKAFLEGQEGLRSRDKDFGKIEATKKANEEMHILLREMIKSMNENVAVNKKVANNTKSARGKAKQASTRGNN